MSFATGGEGIGIALDDYVSNSSVEHSYSHHNAGTGIMLTHESSNNVASYNVIANNGSIGLVVNGYSAGSSNITVLNNTIYGNKSYGMVAWKPVNGLTIKNNILVNNIGYGIGFSSTGITNYTVANNLAFGNTQGRRPMYLVRRERLWRTRYLRPRRAEISACKHHRRRSMRDSTLERRISSD